MFGSKLSRLFSALAKRIGAFVRCLVSLVVVLCDRRSTPSIPLIVSMTSYPPRIRAASIALLSVLAQSPRPRAVFLVLFSGDFRGRGLPFILRWLVHHRNVEIIWVGEDSGSFKKLLPVLEIDDSCSILTVDDDVVYRAGFLRLLWINHQQCPEVVLGTRGVIVEFNSNGDLESYVTWPAAPAGEVGYRVFLTGVGGILYPAGSVKEVFRNSALALSVCAAADDIWFKLSTASSGYPAMCVCNNTQFYPIPFTQGIALWRENVSNHRNDLIMARLLNSSLFPGADLIREKG